MLFIKITVTTKLKDVELKQNICSLFAWHFCTGRLITNLTYRAFFTGIMAKLNLSYHLANHYSQSKLEAATCNRFQHEKACNQSCKARENIPQPLKRTVTKTKWQCFHFR